MLKSQHLKEDSHSTAVAVVVAIVVLAHPRLMRSTLLPFLTLPVCFENGDSEVAVAVAVTVACVIDIRMLMS